MGKSVICRNLVFLSAAALLLTVAGCSSYGPDNNYLRPVDFVRRLEQDGIRVKSVNPLSPEPIAAGEALELSVGESNIGVYKFDINNPAQLARLKTIRKSKRIYFNGIPYPIYEVSGSFIVVGLDKHKEKRRILESLRKFK